MKIDKKVLDEIEEEINKKGTIMGDDLNFFMHRPDNIKIIKKDFIKLYENYVEAIDAPDLFFTSIYSAFRKVHVRTVFLIGFTMIIKRIERLND